MLTRSGLVYEINYIASHLCVETGTKRKYTNEIQSQNIKI